MREDEPTRPVRVPRLRSIQMPIEPLVDDELERRAKRAVYCEGRETEPIPRLETEDESP